MSKKRSNLKFLVVVFFLGAGAAAILSAMLVLGEPQTFNINFVVLTPRADFNKTFDDKFFARTVKRLNFAFSNSEGEAVAKFSLAGIFRASEKMGSACEFSRFGVQAEKPERAQVYQRFEACKDSRVVDPHAINFYVFESLWEGDNPWKTSFAFFNGFDHPFVMVNAETLATGYKVPDVHELGHLFGLLHTNGCGTTDLTPSNVMAGLSDSCEGTAGDRSLGFAGWQLAIVKLTAPIIAWHFDP